MKISFFIGTMMRGGAERVISILANHYCDLGWEVDIIILLANRVDYELDPKINIIDFSRTGNYFKAVFGWLRDIRKYMKKSKPDRVVSFIGRINVLVLTAKLGLKVRTIVSERNDPKHDGRGKLISAYCKMIYKTADVIVYQTEYEKSCFPKTLDTKGYIIPNPVSVRVHRHDTIRHKVVTAGRLLPQKNQELLIAAVAKLQLDYPDIMLFIYGEGSLRSRLEDIALELGVKNNVVMPGNVVDWHEQVADAGVFALSSEFEGQSNALLEAMMIGLPCVTTDYPGADEIIQDGVNGLIVPRGNVDAMADAIKRLFEDDSLRERIILEAEKKCEKYHRDIVLKIWRNTIQ